MKELLLKLYYFGNLSKEKTNVYQTKIRDVEWNAVKKYINKDSKLLDVGCGAGYAMKRAKEEFNCQCTGIDPDPGAHGVGRYIDGEMDGLSIVKGMSESLPFEDDSFDVVYCSHVLEHVNDEQQSLSEMKRVLKSDGVLIIGMPTTAMSVVLLISEFLFTSHQRFLNFILKPFKFINTGKIDFINVFIPPSHSTHRAKTILFDLGYYKISNWKKIVEKQFKIAQTLKPAFYPYPQYLQLFKFKENHSKSSSVFFICNK